VSGLEHIGGPHRSSPGFDGVVLGEDQSVDRATGHELNQLREECFAFVLRIKLFSPLMGQLQQTLTVSALWLCCEGNSLRMTTACSFPSHHSSNSAHSLSLLTTHLHHLLLDHGEPSTADELKDLLCVPCPDCIWFDDGKRLLHTALLSSRRCAFRRRRLEDALREHRKVELELPGGAQCRV
jgi:hypothetical protein